MQKEKEGVAMGMGHGYRCEYCGKSGDIHLGVGMDCDEYGTEIYESARNGELGHAWKEVVEQYPNGSFDVTMEVYQCPSCGYWNNDARKDYQEKPLMVRRKGKHIPMCKDGKAQFEKAYQHCCPRCTQVMQIVDVEETALRCTECGAELTIDLHKFIWD